MKLREKSVTSTLICLRIQVLYFFLLAVLFLFDHLRTNDGKSISVVMTHSIVKGKPNLPRFGLRFSPDWELEDFG